MSPRIPRQEWYHSRESPTCHRYPEAQETTGNRSEETGGYKNEEIN